MPSPRPLSPLRRFAAALGAWLALFLAGPGVVSANGSALLAVAGVALWGAVVTRPLGERRRRALAGEWLAGALGYGAVMWWVWYVVPFGLLPIGAYMGLAYVLGGALARALDRRVPLGVAVAVGWLVVETARSLLDPPFGLGWLRLGHHAHHHLWLAGSARVWGIEGLSFVLAALGGLGAELLARRGARPPVRPASVGLALAALVAAVSLSLASRPPETVDGPRVLLVQPAFEQVVKQYDPPEVNFGISCQLTFRALEEARERGEPEVDLVAWGETMLTVPLFEPEAERALRAGDAGTAPWMPRLGEREILFARMREDVNVRGRIFGLGRDDGPALGAGTSFLAGAEVYDLIEGVVRRRNAVVLYDARCRRSRAAAKRYLVPGAETMCGLERYAAVRETVEEIAGYVPDFAPASETGVLELVTRDGKTFRIGATICFDNAFLAPYTDPAADGPLDFHLVASNEAWYRGSCELDQMVAFSRVAALASGRAIVRATNSGISVVIGPDGREVGRVRTDGHDRSRPGFLTVTVPVPAEASAPAPFYARHRLLFPGFVAVGGLAAWLAPALRRRRGQGRS